MGHAIALRGAALLALALLIALPAGPGAQAVAAPLAAPRCFAQTGFCMDGRIRDYWEANGGLDVFGYPIGPQHEEQVAGRALQVQWFERARLELHPENAQPYDVLLGRLGADRLGQQGRDWNSFPRPQGAMSGCDTFAATGHWLCEPFRTYFHTHGLSFDGASGFSAAESLALFGLPLSEPTMETNASGDHVVVQWFERARLEYHPGNPAAYQVLLGLLGAEIHGAVAAPAPAPPPGGANAGTLPDGWLTRFNAYRMAAGLSPVTEDAQLTAAATKHVAYMMLNPDEFKHDETAGPPGFTAEGQQAAKNSNLFRSSPGFSAANAIDGWMDSLLHRFGMLNPALTRTGFALACNSQGCAAALDVLSGADGPVRPEGAIYPGDGQQGVQTGLITWQFGPFDPSVQVVNATVRDAHGAPVAVKLTVPDGYWNVIALQPSNPLAAGASYTVEINATQNGKALHKLWSFHTK